jgi:hypothetical protein
MAETSATALEQVLELLAKHGQDAQRDASGADRQPVPMRRRPHSKAIELAIGLRGDIGHL